MIQQPEIVPPVTAAKSFVLLGIGRDKGYEMIRDGTLKTVKIGGMIRVPMSEIQRHLTPVE